MNPMQESCRRIPFSPERGFAYGSGPLAKRRAPRHDLPSADERYLYYGNLKFAWKMILGGIASALVGGAFVADGFVFKFLEPIIGGMWWKGAILIVLGIALFLLGLRYRSYALRGMAGDLRE
jgi:hypothetical protein